MAALQRALWAALFVGIHVALALLLITGVWVIKHWLLAIGDPRLFDWMPMRYLFDALDLGVIVSFMLFGGMEVFLLFQENYRGAVVVRGGVRVGGTR